MHAHYCTAAGIRFATLASFHFENGADAIAVENYIKRVFRGRLVDAGVISFRQEALPSSALEQLLAIIQDAVSY